MSNNGDGTHRVSVEITGEDYPSHTLDRSSNSVLYSPLGDDSQYLAKPVS